MRQRQNPISLGRTRLPLKKSFRQAEQEAQETFLINK